MTTPGVDSWTSAVEKALSGLPQLQESLVRLSYFQRLRQDEIARLTGRTPSEVSHLISQGLTTLGRRLEELGPGRTA